MLRVLTVLDCHLGMRIEEMQSMSPRLTSIYMSVDPLAIFVNRIIPGREGTAHLNKLAPSHGRAGVKRATTN